MPRRLAAGPYIHISIYNRGPISRVWGSKTPNLPKGLQRKKLILKVLGFGSLFRLSTEAPEDAFGRLLGAFLRCRVASQLEVRAAPEKVVQMRSSWF